ncbi:hypothetical protein ccbrp13_32900 [Ktedonobacteria bacterium brp13]|nr:hypothetical protein ccbrp13_32900 [Ktedonobacteria bacterium brp13]
MRSFLYLPFEEERCAKLVRQCQFAAIPVQEQASAFLLRKQREILYAHLGISHDALQERAEMRHHASDCRFLKQACVVDERSTQSLRRFDHVQFDIEARNPFMIGNGMPEQIGQIERCGRCILQDESHLEERMLVHLAFGLKFLNHLLERHILVGKCTQGHFAHTSQHFREIGIAG